jgi:hypothetical protein
MEILGDLLLFVIFALSLAFVATVAVFFTYHQARKKGYQPPTASSFVLVGFAVGIAATIALNPVDTTASLYFYGASSGYQCCAPLW